MILGNGRPTAQFTPCELCPLRKRPGLREFSRDELEFVKTFKVDELRVEPGISFLREGTRSEHLYTVLKGWAFRYKVLDDGRRQILNYALPADMVGLQGTLMNEMQHSSRKIVEIVAGLPQSAIFISHDLDLLGGFDRVLVFDGGRVVADDRPSAAIARYLELMT